MAFFASMPAQHAANGDMPNPALSLEQMLAALKREAGASDKAPPPVDEWNPAHCGEIGMEILADGTWRHEGRPIAREPLGRPTSSRPPRRSASA